MKIFISHSSKNKDYGEALVELLTNVGVGSDQIIFTSNDAYGIPTGENIFNWLKSRISEKPHVIYLLSPEYYTSVACLNEMGAAWIVENEHTMIFTPSFELDSDEFQNGVLDPREIGFYLNNEDRLIAFIDSLKKSYGISSNPVIINQKIRAFLKRVDSIQPPLTMTTMRPIANAIPKSSEAIPTTQKTTVIAKSVIKQEGKTRFTSDLLSNKLKDDEVLLMHYAVETGRFKLGAGWQEDHEVENIQAWEDVNELNDVLSKNYSRALKRYEMRKLIEVSDLTSSGNPKEFQLISELQEELLDLSTEVADFINEVVARNQSEENSTEEPLPF